ncbi:MAG: hypothetical protein H0T65_15940 [Deltaproteobacteria bacterium]|nr:hypothetical protein [Deltaproteobacteria bacterium]
MRPLGRMISPGTYVKVAFGGRPARDVTHLGQVPDSSWFENRIGRRAYSVAEAFGGAAAGSGLASGPLTVISGKIEGVSAGFVVRDRAGDTWFLKLDHPAFPELSTSAEVISSRLLWLAGYRVPAMLITDVERTRFELDPKARAKDRYGRSILLTPAAFARLLANTNPDKDGKIRVLISKKPPGEVLGPFSYSGLRGEDVNDTIEHEHRRSLRGLWLFSAWINNTDTREANTLDMFRPIAPDGRGIIEHYLIDFGDAFGSSGLGEKPAVSGFQYLIDWTSILGNLFSFGLRYPEHGKAKRSPVRAIGLFEAEIFEAEDWRPELPNPAFDQRTTHDVFWAASILARIQPDHVRAAVAAGHYREDAAIGAVVDVLLARRTKLLEFAFANHIAIDRPRTEGTVLRLDDLRALGGLTSSPVSYAVRWSRTLRTDPTLARGQVTETGGELVIDLAPALAEARRRSGFAGDPYLTVVLTVFSRSIDVQLRVSGERLIPIAVER